MGIDSDPSYKSVMVSGASAVGKTTLAEQLLMNGFTLLPRLTSRASRKSDMQGEYIYCPDNLGRLKISLMMITGRLLEKKWDDIWFSANNQLYATPRSWVEELSLLNRVSLAPSLNIATTIKLSVSSDNMVWVHLYADPEVRRQRLIGRGGQDLSEIERRLQAGNPGIHDQVALADVNLNSGIYSSEEIRDQVLSLARCID